MQATIVFKKIWDAINEVTETGERRWRYIVLEGSSRSSKTRSLLQAYYLYAYTKERKRLSVWRDVAKDCRDTVGHDMNGVYPTMPGAGGVSFHSTKSIYTFPSKSTIEITGTDDANKVHGYQGDVIWLNEPYAISEATFDQLDMRTSDVVFVDWNPKQGSDFINKIKKDHRTIVIHSTFKDNPFCPEGQRIKILGYQPVSRAEVVVEKMIHEVDALHYDCGVNPLGFSPKQVKELNRCQINEAKGSANAFNWDVYGLGVKGERPNRIFNWRKIPDAEYHKIEGAKATGVDWGTIDPWGIIEAKYYDGALYLHERNYKSENEWRKDMTPADQAICYGTDKEFQSMGVASDGQGIVLWQFNRLNVDRSNPIICDTNRPLKIAALRRAGWPAYPAIKKPGSIVDGIDLLNDMHVYYTESSTNIQDEQEKYSWKTDRYGVVLDEPEDTNNHLMDPARYIAQYFFSQGVIRRG